MRGTDRQWERLLDPRVPPYRGTVRVAPRWRWAVLLALLGSVLPSCATDSSASLAPTLAASTPRGAEQRISTLVHDWFATLASAPPESRDLEGFLAEPSFELSLIGGSLRGLPELEAWRAKLRSTHLDLTYRIDSIAVEPAGEGLHRARFEFERRAVDAEGIPHIARREHAWLVRNAQGEAPVILRIDERPLLAFPGTGPQIVCY